MSLDTLRETSLRAVAGNEAAQAEAARLAAEEYRAMMKHIAEQAVREANRIGTAERWRNAGVGWVL